MNLSHRSHSLLLTRLIHVTLMNGEHVDGCLWAPHLGGLAFSSTRNKGSIVWYAEIYALKATPMPQEGIKIFVRLFWLARPIFSYTSIPLSRTQFCSLTQMWWNHCVNPVSSSETITAHQSEFRSLKGFGVIVLGLLIVREISHHLPVSTWSSIYIISIITCELHLTGLDLWKALTLTYRPTEGQ